MSVNVQFVYGAGNDQIFGAALRALRETVLRSFPDREQVYCPRILDYTEMQTLSRLVGQWKDPTILVGHSCGCMSITRAAVENSMKRIPLLLAIAPSIYCPVVPLTVNVAKAVQATSWFGDFFNPFGRMLLSRVESNSRTAVESINTGLSHLSAPAAPEVESVLLSSIRAARLAA
jgi:hypothetical protein